MADDLREDSVGDSDHTHGIRCDMLDQKIQIGDFVVTSYVGNLSIGRIQRFTKKMVQIKGINHGYIKRLMYDNDVMKIQGEALTMWVLKHEK